MELLREYQKEHPEECAEMNRIKAITHRYEEMRQKRIADKLERIAECRRRLYGGEH